MGVFRKKQQISSLEEGSSIDDIFVVKIKRGISEYVKGFRFNLLLSDSSGKTLEYVYWGPKDEKSVRELYDSIKAGSVVRIQGRVASYNDKIQLATNAPFRIEVLQEGQYEKSEFVKSSKKDIDKLYAELISSISEVEDENMKRLLTSTFNDPVISEKFRKHPGAIEIHHNWIGGLLEHTMEVLGYSKLTLQQFPALNKDLLIAGSLLHDIGKLEELEVTTRIKGTNKGQLAGHLVLGLIYVTQKIDEIDGFDRVMKDKLLHMLISHHGKNEFGSPKEPMFPEALAVYYADELSSKISEMTEFIGFTRQETEDDFAYDKRRRFNIFLK